MGTNAATLKLTSTSDISAITRDLKKLGTEAKTAGAPFQQLSKNLDDTSKKAQTFSQRVQGFGQRFGALSASAATLGGTVINLSRQYQDLGDSQIRVDRTSLKLSKSKEALRDAQGKLDALLKKGVRSGKDYETALLNIQQAEEQVKIQTTLLGEAQEDHQRAQEDFWFGLGPTIGSAVTTAISAISSFTGDKGLGGMKKAVEATSGVIGTGGGKSGGGGTGLLGAIGKIGPALALAAGAAGGVGLVELLAPGQAAADKLTGVNNLGGRTPPLLIPLIGDEKTRKQAIANFESDIIMAQEIVKRGGESPTLLDHLSDTLFGTKNVETKMKAVGLTTEQVTASIKGLADTGSHAEAVYNTLTIAVDKNAASHDGLHTSIEAVIDPLQTESDTITTMASQIQFLDQNMQPLNSSFNLLVSSGKNLSQVLEQTDKSLKTTTAEDSGWSQYQRGADRATQTFEEFKKSLENSQGFDEQLRNLLTNAIFGMTGFEASTAFTIEQLKQLYAAAKEGAPQFNALLKKLKETEMQLWNTGAAAAVTLGPLVRGDKRVGIPKGGRSGKMRIRSDYQKPLIGSPYAQRQMLAGQRKPVYGRSAKPKKKQSGMMELLKEDTTIEAHAGEYVRITPPGSNHMGMSGGGKWELVLSDGTRLDAYIRRVVGRNSGVSK